MKGIALDAIKATYSKAFKWLLTRYFCLQLQKMQNSKKMKKETLKMIWYKINKKTVKILIVTLFIFFITKLNLNRSELIHFQLFVLTFKTFIPLYYKLVNVAYWNKYNFLDMDCFCHNPVFKLWNGLIGFYCFPDI